MAENIITREEFSVDRSRTACFTGHRPEKFPFDCKNPRYLEAFKQELRRQIGEALLKGYNTFLCGMQRGTDIWAGEEVLRLKRELGEIRLFCISPFASEIRSRYGSDRADYLALKAGCNGFLALEKSFTQNSYRARNEFLVDHSSYIIGAIADRKSGTGQTLAYAEKAGIEAAEIDLNEFSEKLAEMFG